MNTAFLGKSIRYNRDRLNLTQEQLAEFLDVSPHYVYELERGLKLPSLSVLITLAEVFHVTIDSMLTSSPDPKESDELLSLIDSIPKNMRPRLKNVICALLPYLNLK